MCFPVNFVKFLRTPFFTEHIWWLLLSLSVKILVKKNIVYKEEYFFPEFLKNMVTQL